MLEHVTERENRSETLKALQSYRETLEARILEVCANFERETGLRIDDIEFIRSPDYIGSSPGRSSLHSVNADIKL